MDNVEPQQSSYISWIEYKLTYLLSFRLMTFSLRRFAYYVDSPTAVSPTVILTTVVSPKKK